MRKVKLMNKVSKTGEYKSFDNTPKLMNKITDKSKDSSSTSNFKPSGNGYPTAKEELNMTPSSNVRDAINAAAKKGGLFKKKG